jgi:hypothetical protein
MMSGKYKNVAYYPGCALEGTGHAYNRSTKELGKALGLKLTDLEIWLTAHNAIPTMRIVEGFRSLALQRRGARGDASFNACRETCRELVYHRNLVCLDPAHPDTARRLRLGAMVARHLALFVGGKLEAAGLGEFCCASRPLRSHEPNMQPAEIA